MKHTGNIMPVLEGTLANAAALLCEARVPAGHWVGELSSSALSTATATIALELASQRSPQLAKRHAGQVRSGVRWLGEHQNADGGFGDTVDSPSNLSTTVLAWTALRVAAEAGSVTDRAEEWIVARLGGIDARRLVRGLEEVYGDDRTFAVPILTACAAAEVVEGLWPLIPRLPFELAALPRGTFRRLGLPVVSYALPALIAIGQALHAHAPSGNPIARLARGASRARTLRVLESIQPVNGGFLEATPLTSFVVLSLCSIGEEGSTVTERGLEFLATSMRSDGSWPIDTNLAMWATTLATRALDGGGSLEQHLAPCERESLSSWIFDGQLQHAHPYTDAAAGGWAWTDLPGGVPDADDTASALLALRTIADSAARTTDNSNEVERARTAAQAGVRWLLDLQNRDGGMPTFCRGWGKLPFDRSCADLTAHALRAFHAWRTDFSPDLAERVDRAAARARRFLAGAQRADGAWLPLWFGSQDEARLENPLYGTSRVLCAASVRGDDAWRAALSRGLEWLCAAQAADGGFGAAAGLPASIEETALGLEALAAAEHAQILPSGTLRPAIERGVRWLAEATNGGTEFPARPIGLYFAQLWYSERLYPLIFSVAALEHCRGLCPDDAEIKTAEVFV